MKIKYREVLATLQNLKYVNDSSPHRQVAVMIFGDISTKDLDKKARILATRYFDDGYLKDDELIKIQDYIGCTLSDLSNNVDFIELEHIHLRPSCGAGTLVIDEPDITPVQIGKSTLESLYKVSDYRYLKTFIASGDSMYDTISDGDMVLVDTSKINCANGGVFLFTKNNDWFIKRLRLRMNGDLEIISDNKKYGAPEIVKPTDDIEINIIGRVLHNLSKVL